MNLTQFDDAKSFLEAARDVLLAREADNNLILGIAGGLAEREGQETGDNYYAVVHDEQGKIVAAAIMTPPFNLMLSDAPTGAVESIARHLLASGRSVPGVLASPEAALRMGELWREEVGGSFSRVMEQRIYQLDAVIEPRPVPGRLRRATADDHALARAWIEAFAADTGQPGTREGTERAATAMIGDGRAWLWETDRPVSMAVWAGPTPNGVRISAVYTPPELRGNGYASACVAGLSRLLLDSGRRLCFLFTDLANPTSNGIYQSIGYRPVRDVDLYRLTPPEGERK